MNCYYHQTVPAVGICKNCYRGLCAECAVEVTNGLACRDRCVAEVETLNMVMERSKVQALRLGSIYRRNAWLVGLMGIVFIVIGILGQIASPGLWFATILMLAFGVFLLVSAFMNRAESRRHRDSAAVDV
jgi:hypothetical protein